MRATGPDHPLLARTLEREASALIEQGRPRDALPLLERGLAINRARYGASRTRRWPRALATSGAGAGGAGRRRRGRDRCFREAIEMQRRARPRPHVDTAEMLAALGNLLAEGGRAAEAEPLLREALRQVDESLPRATGGAARSRARSGPTCAAWAGRKRAMRCSSRATAC